MDEIKEKFCGKWKLDRSENFDEFLKEMGVNFLVRKMAGSSKPEQEIRVDDDTIVVSTKAGFWNKESRMKLNEEFEEDRDGVKMKCFGKYENGVIIIDNTPIDKPDFKPQKVTREIIDNELVMIMNVGDGYLICKRYFKRLP
ncbi:hypothetical protein LOTGIDRAFT_228443 [Lottia gigantea]|uniref:Cytosolic fatty-acid binding proteins domain-containing protein n=1 Tax=Lottia gigantea TaxID=225164 RepID=V4A266_LOTGI|nr:hypothetical protein LOTGIDRAFT_228443 [Lottia gigantea]ESO97928.1 hypothetical protein LOTGIDRAFT_228443 [Lottia gigantea]